MRRFLCFWSGEIGEQAVVLFAVVGAVSKAVRSGPGTTARQRVQNRVVCFVEILSTPILYIYIDGG